MHATEQHVLGSVTASLSLQGADPNAGEAFIFQSEANRSLLSLISHNPVLTRQQMKQEAEEANLTDHGLTCFKSLVAGTGSFQTNKQRVRALPFRYACILLYSLQHSEQKLGLR